MPGAYVRADARLEEEARALTSVLQDGTVEPGRRIAFSRLDKGLIPVTAKDGHVVALGQASEGVRAIFLHSCAAICFLNTRGPAGYVYHANAGAISHGKFGEIMGAIGGHPPYGEVFVAYAHRGDSDGAYDAMISELRGWLDRGQLVQVTNLFLNEFGMNGYFQIGY